MSRWQRFSEPEQLPTEAGCYVIFIHNDPAYIGSTNNVRVRMQSHKISRRTDGTWNTPWGNGYAELHIKFCPSRKYGDWLMQEKRLIRRINPQLNCRP